MAPKQPQALPIRIRRYHRESPSSYIRRVAAANGVTTAVVSKWANEQDFTSAQDSREWLSLWSVLSATDLCQTPNTVHAAGPSERPLCRRCTHGADATGDYADWGLVCLRHNVWISTQDGRRAGEDGMRAERQFRRVARLSIRASEGR